ncbi:hypothetical protein GCM10009785_30770 [Brooklawnia cerclae]|uniref:Uncharacterized protein n=1 Tax=Brooklawnia cerclae TaxID=349934 RepID=A0ABX0SIR3_9ACTN|nr:hypothetical protein [Brooklawnia cerclae]NIH56632.1 hypothetical protein [Brooklawnia cerclae]
MSDFTIEYDAARRITELHMASHDDLAAIGCKLPDDIDGGDGADLLLSILAAVATDAGTLCAIQADAANRMATTVDLYEGVEASAVEAFNDLAKAIP